MEQESGKPSSRVTNKTAKRPAARRSAVDERQAAAMGKIAKGFRRLSVENRRRGPQFLAVLLCVLGLALILYKIFQPAPTGRGEAIEVAGERPVVAGESAQVVSEDHRAAIEGFETALFAGANSDDLSLVLTTVAERGRSLARELLAAPGLAAQEAGAALLALLDALEDEGDPPLDRVAALRTGWLQLRGRIFQPANFFQRPSDQVGSDPLFLTAWRSNLDELQRAVVGATDRAAVLSEEMRTNLDEEVRANARRELADVRTELVGQLEEIRRRVPPRPTGTGLPAGLMEGIQAHGQALELAGRLVVSDTALAQDGAGLQAFLTQIDRAQVAFSGL